MKPDTLKTEVFCNKQGGFMSDKHDAAVLFHNDYKEFLWNTLRFTLRRPSLALLAFRMIVKQKKAMRIRRNFAKTGIRVP